MHKSTVANKGRPRPE